MAAKLDPHDIPKTALFEAQRRAGGVANLAKKLKVSRQFLYICLNKGYVPPALAVEIEKLYGIARRTLLDPELISLVDGKPSDLKQTPHYRT